jgi:hypothetical protein
MIIPLPSDVSDNPIYGAISQVARVQNITLSSGTWLPVYSTGDIKKFIVQARDNYAWKMSTTSGNEYFTIREGAAFLTDLVTVSGTLLFWVSSSFDTTLELVEGC